MAHRSGLAVYLVGGPVRDMILGVPLLDLDFSVEGDAIAFAREVSERLGGETTAHARFGTATVSLSSSRNVQPASRIDFATARCESYLIPGQLPDVRPASIGEDLGRRDFSINAMALRVDSNSEELLDPHGGVRDLVSGLIRVLHPQSFVDDPTRMMRAVRYERRFGFGIERETLELLSRAVLAGAMESVSGARWQAELERLFREDNPVAPLRRMAELGLLRGLHPALGKLQSDAPELLRLESLRRHGRKLSVEECLAALFSRLESGEAEQVVGRLRFPGQWPSVGRDTIGLRESEIDIIAAANSPSQLVRLLAKREPNAVAAWAALTANEAVAKCLKRYLDEWRWVKPELSGEELLEMGAVRGPMVGEILAKLRDASLDGTVNSVECEQRLARELLAIHGATITS